MTLFSYQQKIYIQGTLCLTVPYTVVTTASGEHIQEVGVEISLWGCKVQIDHVLSHQGLRYQA